MGYKPLDESPPPGTGGGYYYKNYTKVRYSTHTSVVTPWTGERINRAARQTLPCTRTTHSSVSRKGLLEVGAADAFAVGNRKAGPGPLRTSTINWVTFARIIVARICGT